MPELPEVETFTRYFVRHALHQRIERVTVLDERILGEVRPEAFIRAQKGQQFASARRHGKHLFAAVGTRWLHLHFGMSGDLTCYRGAAEQPRFARVVWKLAGGSSLAFEDMRLFGVAGLVADPDAFIAGKGLGPDPLDRAFTASRFLSLLAKKRGGVKAVLMTQEVIAGLGNLYVDEMLFQAGVHPLMPADAIAPALQRQLYTAMRRILRGAITRHARGARVPPTHLMQHRESGDLCPRCGGNIKRATVAGRTTYFCAKHQRR